MRNLVANTKGGTETFEPRFVRPATSAQGGRDHEHRFGSQAAHFLSELFEGDLVLIEGRHQSACVLDLGLTPSQHTFILASCLEVA